MPGDTISVYYGEMLISPIPLELSFNFCSHRCRFCFANLNKPDRKADVKATMRLLKNFRERESFESLLLRLGYPVVVSNRVDPFAHSNYEQAVPVLATMTEIGIPVAIQTRGGRGIDDALSFLPPSVWYVSICTLDDEARKRIEPGAPTTDSRFILIEKLVSRGHRVVLGFNPAIREWQPDPTALFRRAKAAGAEGAWIEKLHFNHVQIGNLSAKDRGALTEPLIARARQRRSSVDWQYFEEARHEACEAGLSVFSVGQPNPSDFFRPYRETYSKTFPVLQDFVNWAWREKHEELYFGDFAEVMTGLPSGRLPWGHVFGASAHQIFREQHLGNNLTAKQFLQLCWNEPQTKQCPARIGCFAYRGEDGGKAAACGDDGMAYLLFRERGFDSVYHDDSGKEVPQWHPAEADGKRGAVESAHSSSAQWQRPDVPARLAAAGLAVAGNLSEEAR